MGRGRSNGVKLPVDVQVAIDPDDNTVSISLFGIPMEFLEGVLDNIALPEWRQNILDGVSGAIAAKDLGIGVTQRSFSLGPED